MAAMNFPVFPGFRMNFRHEFPARRIEFLVYFPFIGTNYFYP
jgi:hypothetical protein